jgi:hypothetical protein
MYSHSLPLSYNSGCIMIIFSDQASIVCVFYFCIFSNKLDLIKATCFITLMLVCCACTIVFFVCLFVCLIVCLCAILVCYASTLIQYTILKDLSNRFPTLTLDQLFAKCKKKKKKCSSLSVSLQLSGRTITFWQTTINHLFLLKLCALILWL